MSDKKFDFYHADSFWDLDSIVPPRKTKKTQKFSSPSPVDVTSGSDKSEGGSRFSHSVSYELANTYRPDNSLVREVRIFRRADAYDYHARFVADAEAHLRERRDEGRYVPFFSYSPQYSQMNVAQREYYYYFRNRMRRGEYAKCDEGYFFLFVYEVLNLPHIIPPSEGIGLLCRAWLLCREAYPRIDKYMIQWIVDYALLHALPAPTEWLAPILDKAIAMSDLCEFFVGGESNGGKYVTDATLAHLSAYNFHASRYFSGECGEAMKKHIPQCLTLVLHEKYKESALVTGKGSAVTSSRETFLGALVSVTQRARIEVDYFPLEDNPPLRADMTLAVKYAENKIRAHFSVKSRLSAAGLDEGTKRIIDAYFDRYMAKEKPSVPIPEYEKQYEAPTAEFSIEHARKIEQSSWESTRLLVPEEEVDTEPVTVTPPVMEEEHELVHGNTSALDENEKSYLRALIRGERYTAAGVLEVTLAERINEKALEYIGDVVIEDIDGVCRIIDDYTEDVIEWIDRK